MGSSRPQPMPYVAETMIATGPKSFLDVGMGTGTYGLLARNYAGTWHNQEMSIQQAVQQIKVYGIEPSENVVCPWYSAIYTEWWLSTANEWLAEGRWLEDLDMIWMGDVLEHMPEAEAKNVLATMYAMVDQVLMLAVPLARDTYAEKSYAICQNKLNTHCSCWTPWKITQALPIPHGPIWWKCLDYQYVIWLWKPGQQKPLSKGFGIITDERTVLP